MLGVAVIWTCTSIHHNHILVKKKPQKKTPPKKFSHTHLEYRFF